MEKTYEAQLTEQQLDMLSDEIKLYRKFKGRGIKFVGIIFDTVLDYEGEGSARYENFVVTIKIYEMNALNDYMIKKYGFVLVKDKAA